MQHRVARVAAFGVAVSATIAMVLSSSSAGALVKRPSTTRRVTTTRPPRTTTTRVPRSTTTRPATTTTVAAAGSEPVSTVPGTDTTVPGTPVSSSVPPASEPPRPSEPPKTEPPHPSEPPKTEPPRPSEPPKTEPPRPSEPPKTEPTTTVKHDEPRTPATLTIRCALTERAVSCSWAGDAPGAAHFLLLRSGANVGRAFGPFDPATRTGVDPTIQPHQSYSYLVIARDGSGRTIAHSDPVVVTVP